MGPGLYVHIPFCKSRCRYCSFVSGRYDEQTASAYVEALLREASFYAGEMRPASIYIGGGTPTTLGHTLLSRLVEGLVGYFRPLPDTEITVEANPETFYGFEPGVIADSGVNRVSLGAQSFVEYELVMLGRGHAPSDIETAVGLCKDGGIVNVSLDLIYSLPGQTVYRWLENVRRALSIGISHLSIYDLSVDEGTPIYRDFADGLLAKPREDVQARMYLEAAELLESRGVSRYEISNFARKGCECAHNLNYWNSGDYIGLGVGAHSHLDGVRWENTVGIDSYVKSVSSGKEPVLYRRTLNPRERASEYVMLALRTSEGIRMDYVIERFGEEFADRLNKKALEMEGAGLVDLIDGRLTLTLGGALVSNPVTAEFFL